MLVLVLIACIGLAWITAKWREVQKQRTAVRAIEELGGSVQYTHAESRVETWLRKLLGDDVLAHPDFVEVTDDAAMKYVMELRQTPHLKLTGAQVTDTSLKDLKELSGVRSLWLTYTRVTDAGLEHLTKLSQLERLSLDDTQVSDTTVERLQQALPNCFIQQ